MPLNLDQIVTFMLCIVSRQLKIYQNKTKQKQKQRQRQQTNIQTHTGQAKLRSRTAPRRWLQHHGQLPARPGKGLLHFKPPSVQKAFLPLLHPPSSGRRRPREQCCLVSTMGTSVHVSPEHHLCAKCSCPLWRTLQ
uniref:Uncharacterized protein n=1 Tax=Rousettus aegyptiacus TaxID=9407 RepID=A0A7J8BT02_ROUAE|nr:hypothetical protein HJG63_009637 [Rousettus aegyptiacus]